MKQLKRKNHAGINSKIFLKKEDALPLIEQWKKSGKKIVFTNGCFDLLHRGHVDYLAKAADLGDILIVGLNTDMSVSKVKGPHRPIQDEYSRAFILAGLGFVDAVILFKEDTPIPLLEVIAPHILVKGSGLTLKQIVGSDIVLKQGGKVLAIDLIEGHSTTLIEERIRKQVR